MLTRMRLLGAPGQLDAPRCVPGAEAHPGPKLQTTATFAPHQPPHPYLGRLLPCSHPPRRTTHCNMDSLVAQYSQPAHQNEGYDAHDDQQELMEVTPPLSLKFALPPVAAVR